MSEPKSPTATPANASASERRKRGRSKLQRPFRVRPSIVMAEDFEETGKTANVSRTGLYFITRRSGYFRGMRLFVNVPYEPNSSIPNTEYIGEVVRVDKHGEQQFGIAVHLVSTI